MDGSRGKAGIQRGVIRKNENKKGNGRGVKSNKEVGVGVVRV
jgi:hypothetical protein